MAAVTTGHHLAQLGEWGYTTGNLSMRQRDLVRGIGVAVGTGRKFTEAELRNGTDLLSQLFEKAPELFSDLEEESGPQVMAKPSEQPEPITVELLKRMVAFGKREKCLKPHHHVLMRQIANGEKTLTPYHQNLMQSNLIKLKKLGFNV